MESAATTAVGSVATFEGLTARAPYTVRARSVFLDPQLSDRLGQWGPWIELEGAPHHGVLVCTGAGGGGEKKVAKTQYHARVALMVPPWHGRRVMFCMWESTLTHLLPHEVSSLSPRAVVWSMLLGLMAPGSFCYNWTVVPAQCYGTSLLHQLLHTLLC